MHHTAANKTVGEKARYKPHKAFTCCLKSNPGSIIPKRNRYTAIQVRWTRHNRDCERSKDKLISDVLSWVPTHGYTRVGQPIKSYKHQLWADTGCHGDDLPRVMSGRKRWRESAKGIHAINKIWWWSSALLELFLPIYVYFPFVNACVYLTISSSWKWSKVNF